MGTPLLAQENSAEMPTQAPRPQPQAPPPYPPPHAGEGREGARDFGNPRFVFHRTDGGFLRLDLFTASVASCSHNPADWTSVPRPGQRPPLAPHVSRPTT